MTAGLAGAVTGGRKEGGGAAPRPRQGMIPWTSFIPLLPGI